MAPMLASGGCLLVHHAESTLGFSTYRVDDLLVDRNPVDCACHRADELVGLLEGAGLVRPEVHRLVTPVQPSSAARRFGLVPYQVVVRKP